MIEYCSWSNVCVENIDNEMERFQKNGWMVVRASFHDIKIGRIWVHAIYLGSRTLNIDPKIKWCKHGNPLKTVYIMRERASSL